MLSDSCVATFHDLLYNIYTIGVKYGKYLFARQKYEIDILATSCRFLFLSKLNKKWLKSLEFTARLVLSPDRHSEAHQGVLFSDSLSVIFEVCFSVDGWNL
jgi:hypothetical protein